MTYGRCGSKERRSYYFSVAEGPNSQDFSRTASRLAEMQTREYMGQAHVAGDVATTEVDTDVATDGIDRQPPG